MEEPLLTALRRIAAEIDGPAPSVYAAARAAYLTRDLDGAIAVLIGDSRSAAGSGFAVVRAGPDEAQGRWLLSFSGGGVQIDIEVEEEPAGLRLIGQFTGTSDGEYWLDSSGGRRLLDVDELGRFLVRDVPHGPVRLRCTSADGAPVTTAQVTI
jgi:hypothetical protein